MSKHVTLLEVLHWIAFDNFDGSGLTPAEAAASIFGYLDDVEQIEIAQYTRGESKDSAIDDLFAVLRDGDIAAFGFLATCLVDDGVGFNHCTKWQSRTYAGHASERSEMPAEFWRREGVSNEDLPAGWIHPQTEAACAAAPDEILSGRRHR